MPIDTPAADLVRQLSRVGLRPEERLVEHIVQKGAESRVALLELATNIKALHGELPGSLGPLHALRILGELPDATMIEPLLAGLPVPIINKQDVPARLYANEVTQIIGRVGAPAVPVLWAYGEDENRHPMTRTAAVGSLAFVAVYAPETKDEIMARARQQLAEGGSGPLFNGVVTLLVELGDAESYRPIMTAYREGRIDQGQIPAATVRQFILGGGRRDLTCVNHPLFERYDHHGPRFRDPDEVDFDEDDFV